MVLISKRRLVVTSLPLVRCKSNFPLHAFSYLFPLLEPQELHHRQHVGEKTCYPPNTNKILFFSTGVIFFIKFSLLCYMYHTCLPPFDKFILSINTVHADILTPNTPKSITNGAPGI